MDLEALKMTAFVNAYSLLKIPALAFITPQILELGPDRGVVKVRLDLRTRNHLGVMYFGALAMGAELSIALRCSAIAEAERRSCSFIIASGRISGWARI